MVKFLWLIPTLLLSTPFTTKADTSLEIVVRTDNPIDVQQLDERGRIYRGHVALDVFIGDSKVLAIPQGSPVDLIIRQTGEEEMSVDIASITVKGRRYVMETAGLEYETENDQGDNGKVVAITGSEASGELIQPQGAVIHIPSETVLRFRPPSVVFQPSCWRCM